MIQMTMKEFGCSVVDRRSVAECIISYVASAASTKYVDHKGDH